MSRKPKFLCCAIAVSAAIAQAAPSGPAATSVPFGANGDAVDGTSGQPVALSPTSLLVAAEGADGSAGTADDVTLLVTGLGSAPAVKAITTKHASTYSSRIARLSSARAAMVSSGDDAVRVLEGLDSGQSLDVLRLKVTFARQRPSKPARVTLEAGLLLEDPASLLTEDLTVSIGNVSQTIAAGGLVSVRNGRFLQYSDTAGARGPVRSLTFDTVRRTLRMSAVGADRDLATTAPAYVPVGIDVGGVLVPQSLSARPGRNGFAFRKKRTRA